MCACTEPSLPRSPRPAKSAPTSRHWPTELDALDHWAFSAHYTHTSRQGVWPNGPAWNWDQNGEVAYAINGDEAAIAEVVRWAPATTPTLAEADPDAVGAERGEGKIQARLYRMWIGPDKHLSYHGEWNDGGQSERSVMVVDADLEYRPHRTANRLHPVFTGATHFDGFVSGNAPRQHRILAAAEEMTVRRESEDVGGAECVVVDYATREGAYTAWARPGRRLAVPAPRAPPPARRPLRPPPTRWYGLTSTRRSAVTAKLSSASFMSGRTSRRPTACRCRRL